MFGLLRRPVELSLSGPQGHTIEVRDISLTDNHGNPLLANGDFADGLDRWIFTDDSHVSWRMLNQYLMLFFETGIHRRHRLRRTRGHWRWPAASVRCGKATRPARR